MFNVPKIVTINTGDQKVNFDNILPLQTHPRPTPNILTLPLKMSSNVIFWQYKGALFGIYF